jgi:hypothetical protein
VPDRFCARGLSNRLGRYVAVAAAANLRRRAMTTAADPRPIRTNAEPSAIPTARSARPCSLYQRGRQRGLGTQPVRAGLSTGCSSGPRCASAGSSCPYRHRLRSAASRRSRATRDRQGFDEHVLGEQRALAPSTTRLRRHAWLEGFKPDEHGARGVPVAREMVALRFRGTASCDMAWPGSTSHRRCG